MFSQQPYGEKSCAFNQTSCGSPGNHCFKVSQCKINLHKINNAFMFINIAISHKKLMSTCYKVIMDDTCKVHVLFFTAHKCGSLVACYYGNYSAAQSRYVTGTTWKFRKRACSMAEKLFQI